MNTRKRKTTRRVNADESLSDTNIDYTIDEDFQCPFSTRPRLDRSPISNRTRARVNVIESGTSSDSENMENSNRQVPPSGSTDPTNANQSVTQLETMLERVMTLNHNALVVELNSLKRTIADSIAMSQTAGQNENTSNTSHNSPNTNSNVTSNRNHAASVTPSDSNRSSTTSSAVRIDKWNIIYDGTQDVNSFLFKIETLSRRYSYPLNEVVANFHLFLRGKADLWFWFYLEQRPNTTYSQLKEALIKKFGTVENDCDRIVKMVERRQMVKESFDDFYTDLVSMNSRLSQPLTDLKLTELIKNNCRESLGSLLFSQELCNLDNLRDAARKAEKYLARQYQLRQQKRAIAEIETFPDLELEESEAGEVAAISSRNSNKWKAIDTTNFKCWNCDQKGHSFYECPLEKRNLFCYKCGEKNVTTPQCKNHSGNRNSNEKS